MKGKEDSNQQLSVSNIEDDSNQQHHGEAPEDVGRRRNRDNGPDVFKACNFPILSIKVGDWKREEVKHSAEITFKCFFKKTRFVSEILTDDRKNKVEYKWANIQCFLLNQTNHGGTIEILLKDTPVYFREKEPKPREHPNWEPCSDFTNQPISRRLLHDINFKAKDYENLCEKILAAANTSECLRNLIYAPLCEEDENVDVYTQIALLNGKGEHSYLPSLNLSDTKWVPTYLHQKLHENSQFVRKFRVELPHSNPQLHSHPLPPYPQSFSDQPYYDDQIIPSSSGASFPTQRVLGQPNVNIYFHKITSTKGYNIPLQQTYHQHPSSFIASSSSQPPQPSAIINTSQYYGSMESNTMRDYQVFPEEALVTSHMPHPSSFIASSSSPFYSIFGNSVNPQTDGRSVELVIIDADQNEGAPMDTLTGQNERVLG